MVRNQQVLRRAVLGGRVNFPMCMAPMVGLTHVAFRRLAREYFPVGADVVELPGLSAHGDQNEILVWLRNFKAPPTKTFIVHGEPQASDALRVKIQDTLHWNCQVPKAFEKQTLE